MSVESFSNDKSEVLPSDKNPETSEAIEIFDAQAAAEAAKMRREEILRKEQQKKESEENEKRLQEARREAEKLAWSQKEAKERAELLEKYGKKLEKPEAFEKEFTSTIMRKINAAIQDGKSSVSFMTDSWFEYGPHNDRIDRVKMNIMTGMVEGKKDGLFDGGFGQLISNAKEEIILGEQLKEKSTRLYAQANLDAILRAFREKGYTIIVSGENPEIATGLRWGEDAEKTKAPAKKKKTIRSLFRRSPKK